MKLFFCLLGLLPSLAWAIEPTSREPDAHWAYKTVDGKDFLMDVFLPAGYQDAEISYPVMVIFHGGSWTGGKPSGTGPMVISGQSGE